MSASVWPHAALPARPSESLLIEHLPAIEPRRVLALSLGRGQAAYVAARRWEAAQVECLFLDLYRAQLAQATIGPALANLALLCREDFTAHEVDLALLPLTSTGEAELTRELLQSAFERLMLGGCLLAATDHRHDTWLRDELTKFERRVERIESTTGALYRLIKRMPLKKHRNFSAEVVFRDGPRLLHAVTRPGVFSHRHVDPGARRLIEAMTVAPAARVIDIGCGWGAVALAAAARSPQAHLLAIDSHCRAIACTRHNATLNQLNNIHTRHVADGSCDEPESYDLALANPPYYGNYRIAELFVTAAQRALRIGGELLVVTKLVDWYIEHLPRWFTVVSLVERKGYYLIQGRRSA